MSIRIYLVSIIIVQFNAFLSSCHLSTLSTGQITYYAKFCTCIAWMNAVFGKVSAVVLHHVYICKEELKSLSYIFMIFFRLMEKFCDSRKITLVSGAGNMWGL